MAVVYPPQLWVVCLVMGLLSGPCHGQLRYVNVARGKTCTMSSTWDGSNNNNGNLHGTQLAVNGNTSGSMESKNCVHSAAGDRNVYWEVNLGQPYTINRLVSYGRSSYEIRMSNITVTVDGQLCYTYPPHVTNRVEDFHCHGGVMTSTTVRLTKVTPSGLDYAINLCEFEVYTCVDGYYGQNCQHDCGAGCNDMCNKATGTCSCRVGWEPPRCEQACLDGYYGQNCQFQCGAGCNDACSKTNGSCSCGFGWVAPLCQVCKDGLYGEDCALTCGDHCVDTCDKISGRCTCQLGYKPPLCTEQCDEGKYGQDCAEDCGQGCINGTCWKENGLCACAPGWAPPLCGQKETGVAAEKGSCGTDCSSYLAVAISVSVALAVSITINVVVVVWLWRRQWILPCAGMTTGDKRQAPERDAPSASDEMPHGSQETSEESGYYDVLQMTDMGQKSVYS